MKKRNDGNKIYKIEKASKLIDGPAFNNYGSFLTSVFQNFENDIYVNLSISVDTSKTVAPIKVNPANPVGGAITSGIS